MKYQTERLNNGVTFNQFSSDNDLISILSSRIEMIFKNSLKNNKTLWFVTCGGNTPKYLLQELSKKNINWKNVKVTLTDERLVNIEDSMSNEGMVAHNLLRGKASSVNLYGLCENNDTNKVIISSKLEFLEKVKKIDFLLLGMGEDGHVASIFPDDPNISDLLNPGNKNLYSYVDNKNLAHKRVTLNYSFLSRSKKTVLYIKGVQKKNVIKREMWKSSMKKKPISIFIQKPIEVYWCP
tara:strand:- start:1241 stop:1954 length:714 start_codon:yes stop_codon:yes gene_type:complete